MKFAKIVFWAAGIWGVLILTPLFFIFGSIGRNDPPPVTHPGFYYGFAIVGLAFQFVFMVIATDPVRFRPVMIPAVFEKISYAAAMTTLYFQQRIHAADLVFAGVDFLFGLLFVMAFVKTGATSRNRAEA
jgi:hypothetical protein